MASGSAIDEQYKETWERKNPLYEKDIQPRAQPWTPSDDPNDVTAEQLQAQARQRLQIRPGQSGFRPPIDSSDDED